ncbi:hypothetical protein [Natronospora cellulosivora (SeqCode)]
MIKPKIGNDLNLRMRYRKLNKLLILFIIMYSILNITLYFGMSVFSYFMVEDMIQRANEVTGIIQFELLPIIEPTKLNIIISYALASLLLFIFLFWIILNLLRYQKYVYSLIGTITATFFIFGFLNFLKQISLFGNIFSKYFLVISSFLYFFLVIISIISFYLRKEMFRTVETYEVENSLDIKKKVEKETRKDYNIVKIDDQMSNSKFHNNYCLLNRVLIYAILFFILSILISYYFNVRRYYFPLYDLILIPWALLKIFKKKQYIYKFFGCLSLFRMLLLINALIIRSNNFTSLNLNNIRTQLTIIEIISLLFITVICIYLGNIVFSHYGIFKPKKINIRVRDMDISRLIKYMLVLLLITSLLVIISFFEGTKMAENMIIYLN